MSSLSSLYPSISAPCSAPNRLTVRLISDGKKTGETERERKQRESLNGPAIPLVPSAAVQTRLWMTKTSSSAAGVSLRVCPRQTGTLQQEEMRGVERYGGQRERERSVCWGKR